MIRFYFVHHLTADERPKLAGYALQFMFLGDTGFKFPVAHYPTSSATPAQLYTIVWELVDKLAQYGFKVSKQEMYSP